jgi:hypothetical protein
MQPRQQQQLTPTYSWKKLYSFMNTRFTSSLLFNETTNTRILTSFVRSVSDSMDMKDTEDLNLMDAQDLYTLMLEELYFPLAVYITYSHLRSQSYIV